MQLKDKWPVFNARWRLMTHDLDYGFDWEIERVQISERDPVWDRRPLTVEIEANRGWQSVGVRIPPGTKLSLAAEGSVTLDSDPKPWISQPPGITIQYRGGKPIGQLLACVLPNARVNSTTLPKLEILSVGDNKEIEVHSFSWLLFRINDSVGDQSNNTGSYQVSISP